MKTLRILPDYENTLAFTLPMKNVLLALGKVIPPAKLMHFNKHNLSLKAAWTGISASFDPVEGVTTAMSLPDVSVWVPGTLVLSQRATHVLRGVEAVGELLPVDTPSGPYWILNCLREIEADEPFSQHTVVSGQVLAIDSLRFPGEVAEQAELFKSPFDGYRNLFCSESWMDQVINARMVGLRFSENLVGAFD